MTENARVGNREDMNQMRLPTSVPPDERYQYHPGNDGRDTDHESGKRRTATEVFGIFTARGDDDKERRLRVDLLVRRQ